MSNQINNSLKLKEDHILRELRGLTECQQSICLGYGFRTIKFMIEKDLSRAELNVPVGSEIQGVNSFGRWQAINPTEKVRYVYYPNSNEWVQSVDFGEEGSVDALKDIKRIYSIFMLQSYSYENLLDVNSNLLNSKHKKNQEMKNT